VLRRPLFSVIIVFMRRELARLLPGLAFLALLFGGQRLLSINSPRDLGVPAIAALAAWFLAASAAGTVAHELGHALAVRLVGERVLGMQLGGQLAHVTFSLGTVPVSVGIGLGGSVSFRSHRLSAARRFAVSAAGPAANVLVTPFCLLLPVPRWEAAYLALGVLASGLADLVPGSTDDGALTDGSKLWRTPARLRADAEVRELLENPGWQDRSDAADILINGFRLDVPEAEDCLRELAGQPEELLRLYLKPWALPDKPEADVTHIVDVLSWKVLVTGDLPAGTADLAASRAEWVIEHLQSKSADKRTTISGARQTLALARLRQGRTADVPPLCAGALAADLEPDARASVLATLAMARHARLLSGRQQLDEALTLDPDAQLVSEAARVLGGGWDAVLAAQA
jgi:hypothetical protein